MQRRRITEHGRETFSFFQGARLRLVGLLFCLTLAVGTAVVASAATGVSDSNPDFDDLNDQQAVTSVGLISTNIESMPELTAVDAILRLSPEEAQRGYPIKIRGVVTCVVQEHDAFIIQDATRAVFVNNASPAMALPKKGEFLEIEGKSDKGTFAPLVRANQLKDLGAGTMPEPVQPTWDQLMNGSLDDQFVEVSGIVEESYPRPAGYPPRWSKITLRTTEGSLWVDVWLVGTNFESLENYEDSIVRLRGCLFVALGADSHQLEPGHIRMYVDSIDVDQAAPGESFSVPQKRAADLTRFDPEANSFERVKVSGQILYIIGQDYFMTDGTNGVRFTLRHPLELHTGDLVEVAGYPELSGAAPHLRSAVARKTGHASMPVPEKLSPDDLPNSIYDSTRVRIEGTLVSSRQTATNEVLEVQAGSWRFVARVKQKGSSIPPSIGSRLALVGVYATQGGNPVLDDNAAPFDLLIHSSSDIRILSKPPWWTLKRLLVIVGALVCALAFLGLWVTQLRRQVEQRTTELSVQIQNRQQVEHQRAMEQERARIAQDLHDELGSGITEISMLATVAGSVKGQHGHLQEIGGRAQQMVTALDEIVWAMNPKHDSLASLVSYSCLYADRLLKLANIACQLKGAVDLPDHAMSSVHRHEFFLAFKEAIINVIHHSGATEVRLAVRQIGDRVRLSITDNGQGLAPDALARGGDGLVNMRMRLEKMHGRFAIASQTGRGTIVRFYMPLD
jgi:signal transduction histidine kinase